ncbi:MAG: NACHT domain-containing protein [Symploca sp. SIO3E6]|nr:NACHT domain-containing protein [Caldora sp. SIO3E6]
MILKFICTIICRSQIGLLYKAAVKEFVQEKAVRPILGEAFGKDCKQIDYSELKRLWTQHDQNTRWQFPADEFDWCGVAKEYRFEVKGIIRANVGLRSLLETELLEDIARNTAQISPGFDLAKYQDSLQCSYGYLKLYTLDSTDRVDAIKLWQMFIEQTVREALPPTRYELPLDLQQQLQEEGQFEDLSPEALEYYRREYFQQPPSKVLAAVADVQQAVILGDPGAGKSTLLQYLALDWVEGKTATLPLLIELREYAIAQEKNFLEFLHCGRGADWQFDQQQLHEHLQEHPSLVMFDGLDEVFDRPTQSTIIDEIIRFSQQYPQARVLVTSRIIGYNPERFQQAGFRQFTLQPLDDEEIQEFINRWYDLAMGSDSDKELLKQRLKDAIANSQAIQNLADNPLLLTMMAILNRRQELPRDRTDLYDQASRVLLYHWDVDHKRLELPMDAIGRREKQEMLRLIAYEMQAGEEGLKGNLISAERLTEILTDYLRYQGFSEAREKAYRVIQQLRERNFILCYRGADTYGFVHRTFLEYFCAVEIVNRFEKQRTLSFEQLRDEVFGEHWQDETWHEVLQLICGMIDAQFAGELIEYLQEQECDRKEFLSEVPWQKGRLESGGLSNLLLAADCVSEVSNYTAISKVSNQLLQRLQREAETPDIRLSFACSIEIMERIARCFNGTFLWLKQQAEQSSSSFIQYSAVQAILVHYHNQADILVLLKQWAQHGTDWGMRVGAIRAIAKHHHYTRLDILELFKNRAQNDKDWGARHAAIEALSKYYNQLPEIFDFICIIVQSDPFVRLNGWQDNPRQAALEALLTHYPTHPKTIELMRDRATNDPDEQLREWAQEQLKMLSLKIEESAYENRSN